MDRVRFWGPRFFGKHWGPISAGLTVGELMYDDAYARVSKWAEERGMKRTRAGKRRDPIPPQLKQAPLQLPAKEAASNNLNMSRGRSMIRTPSRASSRMTRTPSRPRSRARSRGKSFPYSKYTGPVPKPNKRPKEDRSIYARKGTRGQCEQNFANVGYNAVGNSFDTSTIGFTSMIRNPLDNVGVLPGSATYHVALSLLRMIFKRHFKFSITDVKQTLSNALMIGNGTSVATAGTTSGVNIPNAIVFYRKTTPHPVGTTTGSGANVTIDAAYTLDTSDGTKTIDALAIILAQNVICSRNFGAAGAVITTLGANTVRCDYELYGYALVTSDANATTIYNSWGMNRLDNWKIAVNTLSVIYFQNTTVSDTNSYSTDVIDSNPIDGKIYYFKHPNPIVNAYKGSTNKVWKVMHDSNGDGVILPDSTTGTFKQLPAVDVFQNCAAVRSLRLDPGEMKSYRMKFKFYGYINKFIAGLKLNDTNGESATGGNESTGFPSAYQYEVSGSNPLGTCALFVFEKTLSTGSGNPLVTYQRNTYTSACWVKQKYDTMLPTVTSEVAGAADQTGG